MTDNPEIPSSPFIPEEQFHLLPGPWGTWGWLGLGEPGGKPEPFMAVNLRRGAFRPSSPTPDFDLKVASKPIGVAGDGIVGTKSVLLIVLLLKIQGCRPILGVVVNHHLSLAENPLVRITQTGVLRLMVYESTPRPVHSILWHGVPTCDFSTHIDKAASMQPWDDDEFLAAHSGLPSPGDLWAQMP